MKRFWFISIPLFFLCFTISANSTESGNLPDINSPLKKDTSTIEWSGWKSTECFSGLKYRLKMGDFNGFSHETEWYIQFKNEYQKTVNFSFLMVPFSQKNTIKRGGKAKVKYQIAPGVVHEKVYFNYLDEHVEPYVYIMDLGIGTSSKSDLQSCK